MKIKDDWLSKTIEYFEKGPYLKEKETLNSIFELEEDDFDAVIGYFAKLKQKRAKETFIKLKEDFYAGTIQLWDPHPVSTLLEGFIYTKAMKNSETSLEEFKNQYLDLFANGSKCNQIYQMMETIYSVNNDLLAIRGKCSYIFESLKEFHFNELMSEDDAKTIVEIAVKRINSYW